MEKPMKQRNECGQHLYSRVCATDEVNSNQWRRETWYQHYGQDDRS